jgi:hypothetical protein
MGDSRTFSITLLQLAILILILVWKMGGKMLQNHLFFMFFLLFRNWFWPSCENSSKQKHQPPELSQRWFRPQRILLGKQIIDSTPALQWVWNGRICNWSEEMQCKSEILDLYSIPCRAHIQCRHKGIFPFLVHIRLFATFSKWICRLTCLTFTLSVLWPNCKHQSKRLGSMILL